MEINEEEERGETRGRGVRTEKQDEKNERGEKKKTSIFE